MKAIRLLDYRLFGVLLLSNFIPLIYSTTRVYFLGSLPETWGFNIASQVAWLNLVYEVLSEGLLLPLYFVLGKVVADRVKFAQRVSLALLVTVSAYVLLSLVVLMFTKPMTQVMGQTAALRDATVSYIRLETIGILMSSVYAVVHIVLVLQKKERLLYKLLVMKTGLIIIFDSLFVSQLPVSLQLGVNGVAWTNIAVNGFVVVFSLFWLKRIGVSFKLAFNFSSVRWTKEWGVISVRSGIESLARNLAFIFMILKLVNEVQQSGVFWITNQFIWGWLLLPILTLGNLIKQDAACNQGELGKRFHGYLQFTALVSLGWLISIPCWHWFIGTVMGVEQAQQVAALAQLLVGFYVVFAFNNILDSYFYGTGRTDLMLYQSLVVNGLFYGSAFFMYKAGYFIPSLVSIAVLFGVGIVVDAVVTVMLFILMKRKNVSDSVLQGH